MIITKKNVWVRDLPNAKQSEENAAPVSWGGGGWRQGEWSEEPLRRMTADLGGTAAAQNDGEWRNSSGVLVTDRIYVWFSGWCAYGGWWLLVYLMFEQGGAARKETNRRWRVYVNFERMEWLVNKDPTNVIDKILNSLLKSLWFDHGN